MSDGTKDFSLSTPFDLSRSYAFRPFGFSPHLRFPKALDIHVKLGFV